jgi:hypothetical protein
MFVKSRDVLNTSKLVARSVSQNIKEMGMAVCLKIVWIGQMINVCHVIKDSRTREGHV